MHGWETTALDDVGHVAAQVGVDDLWASDAHDRAHLLLGQVADLENTGLLSLDQKNGFVVDLGVHGGRHGHFVHALGNRCAFDAELDVHAGRGLLEQDAGGIGLFQRSFFEVDALNLKDGFGRIGHGNP